MAYQVTRLIKRANALINDVSKQVNTRNIHFPAGIKQNIVINTGGLVVDPKVMDKIIKGISAKTNTVATKKSYYIFVANKRLIVKEAICELDFKVDLLLRL